MIVGSLEIAFRLEACRSLKDKRRVVRSLVDRLRHDFRASVSEVADHDLWGNATLGIAIVGSDARQVESVLQKVLAVVEANPDAIVDYANRNVVRT